MLLASIALALGEQGFSDSTLDEKNANISILSEDSSTNLLTFETSRYRPFPRAMERLFEISSRSAMLQTKISKTRPRCES